MANEQLGIVKFTQPINQIITMLILTGLALFGAYMAFPSLGSIFVASPYLNGLIILVFVAGLLTCFVQVFSLIKSVIWIEAFAENRLGHETENPPSLLASLAAFMSDEGARYALTSNTTRSLLDSVATRLDEGRELTRYVINLLIFLGLLGTFFGLAITVPAVVDTIRSLVPQDGESSIQVFDNLMVGLEAQLGGMGTAFGSSLLGLAGSLVIGLLDLFSGRGQNRFYSELEEFLASITRITVGGGDGGSDLAGAGLFENATQSMQAVQNSVIQSGAQVAQVAELVGNTITQSAKQQSEMLAAIQQLANGQAQLLDAVAKMQSEGEGLLDAETRMRLRSMDEGLYRLSEELSEGRAQNAAELRAEITNLIKALTS